MTKRFIGTLAATLVALLGFALSVWGVDEKIALAFPAATPVLTILPILCLCILALALVLLGVQLVFLILGNLAIPSTVQNVTSAACREEDLPRIKEIAEAEIGAVTSEADTLALYRRNRQSFRKIIHTEDHQIIGYFCVLPLTEIGLNRVRERNLLAPPIDTANIAQGFRRGSVVYIGGVAGVGRKGRAGALQQLKLFLLNKSVVEAYTRPMTSRGVDLAKQAGFKPLSETDKLAKGVYAFKIRDL